MTKEEWLNIGYTNKVIDVFEPSEYVYFNDVYQKWFIFKLGLMRPQSADRIESTYNKYFKEYRKYLHEIDEVEIIDFINKIILDYGINLKELYRIKQIFKEVLSYAVDYGYSSAYEINWDKVKRNIKYNNLSKKTETEYCISDKDKMILFREVLDNDIYPEKKSICLCILANFYLGLRIGELSSLEWSNIDFKNKVVNVKQTFVKSFERDEKGKRINKQKVYVENNVKTVSSFRQVPMTKECIYILTQLKQYHKDKEYDSKYICYDGREINYVNSITKTLRNLCTKCGIEPINSHLIRKCVATQLHKSGVATRYISDILGHNDISTTEKCYILSDSNINTIRKKMDIALSIKL